MSLGVCTLTTLVASLELKHNFFSLGGVDVMETSHHYFILMLKCRFCPLVIFEKAMILMTRVRAF